MAVAVGGHVATIRRPEPASTRDMRGYVAPWMPQPAGPIRIGETMLDRDDLQAAPRTRPAGSPASRPSRWSPTPTMRTVVCDARGHRGRRHRHPAQPRRRRPRARPRPGRLRRRPARRRRGRHRSLAPTSAPPGPGCPLLLYTSGTTGAPKGVPITRGGDPHLPRRTWPTRGTGRPRTCSSTACPCTTSTASCSGCSAPSTSAPRCTTPAAPRRGLRRRPGHPLLRRAHRVVAHRRRSASAAALSGAPAARVRQRGPPGPRVRRDDRARRAGADRAVRHDGDPDHPQRPGRRGARPRERRATPAGIEARIVDDDGAKVPVGAMGGAAGARRHASSPATTDPGGSTAGAFTPDGWFRTGDVAARRRRGPWHIVGRASTDLIKSGGYRIGAGEVEDALLSHPAVDEAAVVGVPDDDLGQRLVAFVVADGRGRGSSSSRTSRTRCPATSALARWSSSTRCPETRWARSTRAASPPDPAVRWPHLHREDSHDRSRLLPRRDLPASSASPVRAPSWSSRSRGCLKLDARPHVNADATATGTLAFEFQKEAAGFLGISDLASFEENFSGEELRGGGARPVHGLHDVGERCRVRLHVHVRERDVRRSRRRGGRGRSPRRATSSSCAW